MTRNPSKSNSKERKIDSTHVYDTLKPIKGKLVKLLKDDIEKDALEYRENLHLRVYKKIRQQKDAKSISVMEKNLRRMSLQKSKEERMYEISNEILQKY